MHIQVYTCYVHCIHTLFGCWLGVLITGDAAVDGGLLAGIDDKEGQADGRVVGGRSQVGHPLAVPFHQVLE